MAEIQGEWEKRFQAVRDALAESLEEQDVGASAAVFVDGEPVVDIWGGYADAARAAAWERDTIVNVYSVSKTSPVSPPGWPPRHRAGSRGNWRAITR